MGAVRAVLAGAGLIAALLWMAGFGAFGMAAVFIAPPVGLFALALAALPLASGVFLWLCRDADRVATPAVAVTDAATWPHGLGSAYAAPVTRPDQITRRSLERGLLTGMDLAVPMAGPGARGPWMPVDVTVLSPPAVRPLGADGEPVPMLAEAGIVLAGPGPQQAVRHMIAAYEPATAEAALSSSEGAHLGVFGAAVAAMARAPDAYPVGEVRTTVRIAAADGVVSHVVVWRRGPLIAHLAASGDETLAQMLLGHATQVADTRLLEVLASIAREG